MYIYIGMFTYYELKNAMCSRWVLKNDILAHNRAGANYS